jgi:ribose transport system ATP-binding protein
MKLHQIIRGLRDRGVGIVYISHRLDEVFDIADRMTVMKDGQTVGTVNTGDVKVDDIIRMMVGRPIATMFPERAKRVIGAELLKVENLNAGRMVRDVSFSVRAGEIVGLGGLIGSGRTEVARVIFGADPLESGTITLKGKVLKPRSPKDAVEAGIGLVPEDRKQQGVILDKPIRVNSTMAKMSSVVNAFGFLKRAQGTRRCHGARQEPAAEGVERRCAGLQPVRRQPAESRAGQVVSCRWRCHHPR